MMTDSSVEKIQNRRIVLVSLVALISLSVVLSAVSLAGYLKANSSSADFVFENKINPNTAVEASLTRLPGIGTVKAKQIVIYRSNFPAEGNEGHAFKTVSDLDNVPGIGPGTINNIYKLLKFD